MVGGDDNDLKQAEPVLQKMGATIFKCGSIGAGQIAKICNNLILGKLKFIKFYVLIQFKFIFHFRQNYFQVVIF